MGSRFTLHLEVNDSEEASDKIKFMVSKFEQDIIGLMRTDTSIKDNLDFDVHRSEFGKNSDKTFDNVYSDSDEDVDEIEDSDSYEENDEVENNESSDSESIEDYDKSDIKTSLYNSKNAVIDSVLERAQSPSLNTFDIEDTLSTVFPHKKEFINKLFDSENTEREYDIFVDELNIVNEEAGLLAFAVDWDIQTSAFEVANFILGFDVIRIFSFLKYDKISIEDLAEFLLENVEFELDGFSADDDIRHFLFDKNTVKAGLKIIADMLSFPSPENFNFDKNPDCPAPNMEIFKGVIKKPHLSIVK